MSLDNSDLDDILFSQPNFDNNLEIDHSLEKNLNEMINLENHISGRYKSPRETESFKSINQFFEY